MRRLRERRGGSGGSPGRARPSENKKTDRQINTYRDKAFFTSRISNKLTIAFSFKRLRFNDRSFHDVKAQLSALEKRRLEDK